MKEAPRIEWWAATEDADGKPNTWTARFGDGYLVLHASPIGDETMVHVPYRRVRRRRSGAPREDAEAKLGS